MLRITGTQHVHGDASREPSVAPWGGTCASGVLGFNCAILVLGDIEMPRACIRRGVCD